MSAIGGVPSSGGALATGGTPGNGGTPATGGTPGNGGAPATGGTPGNGDTPATGGTPGNGGTPTTGGTPGVGGFVVTGGASSTGGFVSTGGTTGNTGGQPTGGSPGTGGATSNCPTVEEETFSFFLMSNEAVQRESGSPDGFGGDLGGLAGADAICQRVAEYVSPCQSSKTWRAFLSTTTENAIDRIGQGPWYDRIGRLLANSISELLNDRPINADREIIDDFPNEYGIPNHDPDGTGDVDNHQILTGSGTDGRVYFQTTDPVAFPGSATACGPDGEEWTVEKATCWNWTSSQPQGCPRVGHSWPRDISGNNWISVWNEGGCAPGGVLHEDPNDPMGGGLDGTRRVGSAGGYGGWYCFAVTP